MAAPAELKPGQSFGKLTVMECAGSRNQRRVWRCRCECGNVAVVPTYCLVGGNTRSCGCGKAELTRQAKTKHGMSRTAIYRIWCLMRSRCHDPRSQDYANYGGRGVTVCAEWRDSFQAFLAGVGDRPSVKHSLDRIDVNRGYEPGNVRWAEQRTQCNNKRTNVVIEYDGERLTAAEWAARLGMDVRRVIARHNKGWPVEKVLAASDLRTRGPSGPGSVLTPEQGVYYAMIRRCTKTDDPRYPRYGGRGIEVCDRWLGPDGFNHFLADLGPKPHRHSLERVDNDGPYSPENCRWASYTDQARNTRRNRHLTSNGETLCVSAWGEKLGIPPYLISMRLARGWPVERALSVNPERAYTGSGRSKSLTRGGVTKTYQEWAKETGISARVIARRLNLGWGVEEALSTPVRITDKADG